MPDWVNCEVKIIGPAEEIARLRAAHIRRDKDGNDTLDFDTVIPMPHELRDTRAPSPDAFIWALGGYLHNEWSVLSRLTVVDETPLNAKWVRDEGITTREELLRYAEKEHPDQLDAARRAMEAERITGYRNWHDWKYENWGCKSGCYGFSWENEEISAFSMMTPRYAPKPILWKLSELYPRIIFTCHFVNEANESEYSETYVWGMESPI